MNIKNRGKSYKNVLRISQSVTSVTLSRRMIRLSINKETVVIKLYKYNVHKK